MIDKKLFQEKTIQEKIKFSFLNMSAEKTFYVGVYISILFIFLTISVFYFFSKKTLTLPKYNTKLNVSSVENLKYTLPVFAENATEKFVSGLLYSSLKKKNVKGVYVYDLAESITETETEKNNYNIKIRNDARFSDGSYINSDDIIYSYELATDINIDYIDRVKYEGVIFEKIDDRNLSLSFDKNFLDIDDVFTLGIIKKNEFENQNKESLHISEKSIQSISSGPYLVSQIIKTSSDISEINLIKNKHYYKPVYNRVMNIKLFQNINDLNIYEIENEISDIIMGNTSGIDPVLLERFSASEYKTPKVTALFLNPNKNSDFAKKEIREKFFKILDRESIVKNSNLLADPVYGILATDIEKKYVTASEGLATTTINIKYPDTKQNQLIINQVKQNLEINGFTVNLKNESQAEILSSIKNRDYDVLFYTLEIESPATLYPFWHSSQRNAPGLNITGYTSKNMDDNLDKIKKSTSTESVKERLAEIDKEINQEYPYIPLYSIKKNIFINKEISKNIKIPEYIYNNKNLSADIINWYKDKEKIWPVIQKYNTQVEKIYKLIH
jgi:peptide/nickel transport system substrate-binding protein